MGLQMRKDYKTQIFIGEIFYAKNMAIKLELKIHKKRFKN